jgi:serine/threonine protein kinase
VRVVKIVKIKDSDVSRLEYEIDILSNLHNPNIVHLYEIFKTSEELYMVMEYVDGLSLTDWWLRYAQK